MYRTGGSVCLAHARDSDYREASRGADLAKRSSEEIRSEAREERFLASLREIGTNRWKYSDGQQRGHRGKRRRIRAVHRLPSWNVPFVCPPRPFLLLRMQLTNSASRHANPRILWPRKHPLYRSSAIFEKLFVEKLFEKLEKFEESRWRDIGGNDLQRADSARYLGDVTGPNLPLIERFT